jgi:hypothetical protein
MRSDHGSVSALLRDADAAIDALQTYARLRHDRSVVAKQADATIRELVRLLVDSASRATAPDYAAIARAYSRWHEMFGGDARLALNTIRHSTGGQYSGMGGAGVPVGLGDNGSSLSVSNGDRLKNFLDRARGIPDAAGDDAQPGSPGACWGDVRACRQGFGFKFQKSKGELFLPQEEETKEMTEVREQLVKEETQLNDIRTGTTKFIDPVLRKKAEDATLESLKQDSLRYDDLKQKKLKGSEHGA